MDLSLVDAKQMKTLESYGVALITGMISLQTLASYHVRAVEIGILKEDHIERCNTILWDIKRLLAQYKTQTEAVLELLPDAFSIETVVEALKKNQVTQAKKMIKKSKESK